MQIHSSLLWLEGEAGREWTDGNPPFPTLCENGRGRVTSSHQCNVSRSAEGYFGAKAFMKHMCLLCDISFPFHRLDAGDSGE